MADFGPSQGLRERFEARGQGHCFKYVNALSPEEAAAYIDSLEALDLDRCLEIYSSALASHGAASSRETAASEVLTIEPLSASDTIDGASLAEIEGWRSAGLELVAQGRVAALILAGGQGTRLGFDGPKGLYDIGLPSKKPLFQLNCDKIRRLGELSGGSVPLVVMTSDGNAAETRRAFEAAAFYGLGAEDVFFFSQGALPAFTPDGKLLLASGGALSFSPDGNGGVYRALAESGTLAALAGRGVDYVHVVSVDNALCKPCDPVFVGYCAAKKVDVASKAVWKASPSEKVGVLCTRRGRPGVVEYSELPQALAELVDARTGRLVYGAGNVCNRPCRRFGNTVLAGDGGGKFAVIHRLGNHLLSTSFLARAAEAPPDVLPFHVARKAVAEASPNDPRGRAAAAPDEPNAVKLEAFIFDAFALADDQAALGVDRASEFAAVKNAPGSATDSPEAARTAMLQLGAQWLRDAGAIVLGDCGAEVSGRASYAGEGLEDVAKGKTFDATTAPCLVDHDHDD